MKPQRKLATAVTAVLLSTTAAQASDQYSFPSASGAVIVNATPTFVYEAPAVDVRKGALTPSLDLSVGGVRGGRTLLPVGGFMDRYGTALPTPDAFSYRLLTHMLSTAAFANYAADYHRLFYPNDAVTSWTERMAGIVDVGYGGAVDSWTAGAYYLGRVRNPVRRRDAAPDLSLMPTFRSHPELERQPTFEKPAN